jgi:choline dehydrogenase-like flavoprotein
MNEPSGAEYFDVIIVGSGAGGAAAAYRLGLQGLRVLVVEKGRALPLDGSTLDVARVVQKGEFLSRERWRDGHGQTLTPEEHFNLGGKTKWYGAALLRFGRHEFGADDAYGCPAWPLAMDELDPWYEEAERLLGVREFAVEPAMSRIQASLDRRCSGWVSRPLPMALAPNIVDNVHEARHFDGFATVRNLKADAENALLRPLADLPNVRILTDAPVADLLPDPAAAGRVAGVRLEDGRGYRAAQVLLAAGALHSPRLLSRYLRTQARSGGLPAVGRYLKLHLLTAMVAVSPAVKNDLVRKTVLLTHERYPHSSVQPLGFDAELLATLMPKVLPRALRVAIGQRGYGFFLQTEDPSHADNRVYEDETGPVLDYDARRTPAAQLEHRRFVHGFQRALGGAGLVSFTQRIGLAGTAHACGTLAAGGDPATSVVDATGRVHGIEGLYVVDGSVLTRLSRVNPSLTIFAWGLRVADLLAARLGASRPTSRVAATQQRAALA